VSGSEPLPPTGIVDVDKAALVLTDWSDRITLDQLRREAERVVGE